MKLDCEIIDEVKNEKGHKKRGKVKCSPKQLKKMPQICSNTKIKTGKKKGKVKCSPKQLKTMPQICSNSKSKMIDGISIAKAIQRSSMKKRRK